MSVREQGLRSYLLDTYRRTGKPRTMVDRYAKRKKKRKRYDWVSGNGPAAGDEAAIGTGSAGGGGAGGGT